MFTLLLLLCSSIITFSSIVLALSDGMQEEDWYCVGECENGDLLLVWKRLPVSLLSRSVWVISGTCGEVLKRGQIAGGRWTSPEPRAEEVSQRDVSVWSSSFRMIYFALTWSGVSVKKSAMWYLNKEVQLYCVTVELKEGILCFPIFQP